MEENEHINKHLKHSLDNYLVQPRISSFDEILKKMQKKKRRRFVIFFLSGLLLLTGATSFYLLSYQPPSQDIADLQKQEELKTAAEKPANLNKRPKNETQSQTEKPENENSLPPTSPLSGLNENKPLTLASNNPRTNKIRAVENKTNNFPVTTNPSIESSIEPLQGYTPSKNGKEETVPENSDIVSEPLQSEHLTSFSLLLPINEKETDVLNESVREIPDLTQNDSSKKEKNISFLFGVYITPQEGSYQYAKNAKGDLYNSDFSGLYLKNKKEQNEFRFFYGLGIKTGIVISNKWEILAGIGYQRFSQEEVIKRLTPVPGSTTTPTTSSSVLPIVNSGANFDAAAASNFLKATSSEGVYKSIYQYWDYSLEINRLFSFTKTIRLKAGAGFHARQFRRSSYLPIISTRSPDIYDYTSPNASVRKWMGTISVKAGLIKDLGKSIQMHFSPVLFYSPNSMFVRNYVIKQRSYSAGLECSLLFKLR